MVGSGRFQVGDFFRRAKNLRAISRNLKTLLNFVATVDPQGLKDTECMLPI